MKLLQAILFSTLVTMTALAHADAKLDKLVEKCDQLREQIGCIGMCSSRNIRSVAGDGTAWGEWIEKMDERSNCRRNNEDGCNRFDGAINAAENKARALQNKLDSLNCSDAREQQRNEAAGLSGK